MNDQTNEAKRSRASFANDKTNEAQRGRASSTSRNRTIVISAIVAAGLAVVAAGAWLLLPPTTMTGEKPEQTEREVLYWTDPMVPGFKADKPGKSPFMDMQLVPVYKDDGDAMVVNIRPEVTQNLGVRTYTVNRDGRARRITASGYLFRDARGLALLVDVIARDAFALRVGNRAEVRVTDVPGQALSGVIETIESDMDIGARTVKARIRLNSANAALRANMYAEATIQGPATPTSALFIPREALIRTGTRNTVVLALGEGRFQPVDVTPGVESGDWIEILHGIKEADNVVTSGQFLIDSEASVRASFQRMQSVDPTTAGEPPPAGAAPTGR